MTHISLEEGRAMLLGATRGNTRHEAERERVGLWAGARIMASA